MITERMEYQPYLAIAKPFDGVDLGLTIGHLHMHAFNLEQSRIFYERGFGMNFMQAYGNQALFLSFHQYHHHLGVNTWIADDAVSLTPLSTGYDHSIWLLEKSESIDDLETRFHHLGYPLSRTDNHLVITNLEQQKFMFIKET
jgi:catechol 2,3-dioxygenase